MSKTHALIGTSGWTYDGWRGPFYPDDVRKKDWLRYYASRFSTTEINGSFYRTPTLEAVRGWRHDTPKHFGFAWKASKFISHWKRLSSKSENSIALMESRLKALAPKVVAILFQLPPQFSKNRERLESFLRMLPRRQRYVFEFRHKSWYDDDILDVLHRAGRRAVSVRPSRRAIALGGDGAACAHSRSRAGGALSRQLFEQDAGSVGGRDC